MSARANLLIKEGEGWRSRVYKDTVGKSTIGWGFNIDDRDLPKEVAELWLDILIKECESELNKNIPWWKELSSARKDVLIDMCYNLGITRLLGFKKFLEFLKAGKYKEASLEGLDSQWARQVKGRATKLMTIIEKGDTSW